MRKKYEMTDEQLSYLLEACKPVPYIAPQCGHIRTPQENANAAWKQLGEEMGFDYLTVRPILGKPQKFFTAVAK